MVLIATDDSHETRRGRRGEQEGKQTSARLALK